MRAYPEVYLHDIVESQGKLFDFVSQNYPEKDTSDFINTYMTSKTRESIDQGKAYVSTMNASELWDYFQQTEHYHLKNGKALKGFIPDWIGEFYAYYQWFYNVSSKEIIKKVPLDFLTKAYMGLHDLELDLAVKKVTLGLRFNACTSPLNLPAPGRRQLVYVIFRFSTNLCFFHPPRG